MAAAPIIVLDASVILKWVLPPVDEPDIDKALALRDAIASGGVVALAPDLWIYEAGNLLALRFPDRAADLLDSLLRFDLAIARPSKRWLRRTLELTQRYGVTFYDAAYHAHAIVERGEFVTADARYFRHAGEAGAIMLLSAWSAATA